MKAVFASLAAAAVLLWSHAAPASERRPRVEQDDCSRRSAQCEQRCDSRRGADRLSCKTDCRLVESQCRNGKK